MNKTCTCNERRKVSDLCNTRPPSWNFQVTWFYFMNLICTTLCIFSRWFLRGSVKGPVGGQCFVKAGLIATVNQGFKEIRFVVNRIGFLMAIKKRKTLITFCWSLCPLACFAWRSLVAVKTFSCSRAVLSRSSFSSLIIVPTLNLAYTFFSRVGVLCFLNYFTLIRTPDADFSSQTKFDLLQPQFGFIREDCSTV